MKQACIAITVLYVVMLIFVYIQQKSFIFFPIKGKHTLKDAGSTEYTFSHAGVTLNGWLINSEAAAKRLIIYYGGNAEEIFFSIGDFKAYENTTTLLVNYRGYGSSDGKPGEKELFADALAIIDDITNTHSPQKIFLMGRSLGSGVATYVASKRAIDGIILISPFDSLESLARRQFPFLPTSLLLKHRFRSIDYVDNITCPGLVIYGGKDGIVPPHSTRRLLNHFNQKKIKTVYIEEGGHNNIETFADYSSAIQNFVRQ